MIREFGDAIDTGRMADKLPEGIKVKYLLWKQQSKFIITEDYLVEEIIPTLKLSFMLDESKWISEMQKILPNYTFIESGIPSLVVYTPSRKASPYKYLHSFREYYFQMSGTHEGGGDYGNTGHALFKAVKDIFITYGYTDFDFLFDTLSKIENGDKILNVFSNMVVNAILIAVRDCDTASYSDMIKVLTEQRGTEQYNNILSLASSISGKYSEKNVGKSFTHLIQNSPVQQLDYNVDKNELRLFEDDCELISLGYKWTHQYFTEENRPINANLEKGTSYKGRQFYVDKETLNIYIAERDYLLDNNGKVTVIKDKYGKDAPELKLSNVCVLEINKDILQPLVSMANYLEELLSNGSDYKKYSNLTYIKALAIDLTFRIYLAEHRLGQSYSINGSIEEIYKHL